MTPRFLALPPRDSYLHNLFPASDKFSNADPLPRTAPFRRNGRKRGQIARMKGRILVVEDNLITAEVISQQLWKLGYTVAQVLTTGEEAVRWMLSNDADLILMDVQLDGDMDGVETASFIRGQSDIPIVYLTANSDLSTVGRASETRASGFLSKPFDRQALHNTIQMALGRRHADSRAAGDLERLVRTLAALPQAVITIDSTGSITAMNALAEELTGCAVDAARGQDISDIVLALNQQGRNIAGEFPRLFLTADLSPIRQSVTVVSANGGCRVMELAASPILDESSRMTGIVLSFQEGPGMLAIREIG